MTAPTHTHLSDLSSGELHLTGLHHLTAVSADIRENKRFYTEDLGMRLVKRTVNQDDTSAYHLFYADGAATPGTDITFFDWPAARERRGNHTVTRTALRVKDDASLSYWQDRFRELGTVHSDVRETDGRHYLDFEDPEGQRLSLVVDGGASDSAVPSVPWDGSAVPAEHQIRGLGPVTMSVPSLRATDLVLQKALGFRPVRDYADPTSPVHRVQVYEMGLPGEGGAGPHAELHVAERPDLPPARPGAGGVHHVAFRTPNDEQYHAWAERLQRLGIRFSGEIDRYYFRSLYFREPGGVLFEIATDGPGFAVDEDMATLGQQTILPPKLEPRRAEILSRLKPLD